MVAKILFVLFAVFIACGCASTITQEQYIGAMAALGCNNATEKSPSAPQILKEAGVGQDQVIVFRKKMDQKKTTEVAMEIARRVMECHGVKQ